ncbi:amino acid adenylation domain-containing protein [Actinokineospora sp.]|uniref:amino acid adenylation domain-containing protein n=1 Tax=Actinokineospora sp. TaxID=1872133 RepID=UPI004037A090
MADIEDIYPLTAPQQGMLFHSVSAVRPGVYVEQVVWELAGELDLACLAEAWQLVVDRNPVLRTGFLWREVDRPLQVVRQVVRAPMAVLDWRTRPDEVRDGMLDALLAEDRDTGFDLDRPPLVRLTAIRVDHDRLWLMWSCHHAVLDGWSVGELRRELLDTHRRLRLGGTTAGPARRPFREFVAWLDERPPSGGQRYWKERMGGFHTPLRLPDGMAPTPDGGLDTVVYELTGERSAATAEFGRRHRLTVNTLIQGAWAVLLSRYCGQSDVVFGVTSSGRPADLAGVESMVGPFVATTPLRVLVGAGRVVPWLRAIQRDQADARDHEHTPLPEVHAMSQVPRGTPLFETVLAFENHLADATGTGTTAGVAMRTLRGTGHTNFPVTVIVTAQDAIRIRLTYDTSRFDRPWMRRLAGHFRRVLAAMIDSPDLDLDRLPMLDDAELAELAAWNDTGRALPDVRLDTLVLRQCARLPDAEAVVSPGRRLSYGELADRSAALARRLVEAGAGPDRLVAVVMARGWEQVVAVLAVLRVGAAYLPIDAAWPVERVHRLLSLGDCTLAVTQADAVRELVWPAGVRPVPVGAEDPPATSPPPADPTATADLAYVVYTSGSTGEPKGVAVEHRTAVNTILDVNERFGVGPGDRVLALSPLSFDLSVWDVFGILAAGGTVVLPEPATRPDPARWAQWIASERVTVWDSVPALLDRLVDRTADEPGKLATLRLALLSGDWIPVSLPDRFRALVPDAAVVSLGGATEGSIWSICHPVGAVDPAADSIPYGTPLANQRFHVLDSGMRPVPAGVPGELYIGGSGVARGYWRDPERTRASFPLHPVTGERLYRTGDLGRHGQDGVIRFLGRVDDQVKINGFRVEPGEVEKTLAAHPDVADVAVGVHGDRGRRSLVAYVVGGARPPAAAELRTFVSARLPAYLVPARVLVVSELPRTANGKLDRAALARSAATRPELSTQYTPARTPVERLLASIWCDVLGVDAVGTRDNFFELGGDSLRSMRVSAQLHRNDIDVPVGAIFDRPTIGELAEWISQQRDSRAEPSGFPEIASRDHAGLVPLTYPQEMVQILNLLTPGNTAYVPRTAVEFVGDLDAPALTDAVRDLVRRHPALRTVFRTDAEGRLGQEVLPTVPVALARHDVIGLSIEDAYRAAGRVLAEEVALSFAPARGGPLFRFALVRTAPARHILLLAVDHLVCDGWSLGILTRDLFELYRARAVGAAPNLPELPVTYADFALWQREHLAGERLARTIAFWRDRMAGAPPMQLPSTRPPVPLDRMRGAVLNVRVERVIADGLAALARAAHTSLFATLMAAVQAVVWSRVGGDKITVSAPAGGRIRPEIQDVVGCFVHGMMFPTDMSGDPSFAELVERVRAGLRAGWEHQALPLQAMAEIQEFATVNGMGTQGIALEWVDEDTGAVDLPGGVAARPWWPRREGAVDMPPADLFVYLHRSPVDGGMAGEFMYNSMRFDRAEIAAVFDHLHETLRLVAVDSSARLSTLARVGDRVIPSGDHPAGSASVPSAG